MGTVNVADVKVSDNQVISMMPDTTKIRNHLLTEGHITSLEAFVLYGITRLAAVIYKLRYKIEPCMDIRTVMEYGRDRYGQPVQYGVYVYKENENA